MRYFHRAWIILLVSNLQAQTPDLSGYKFCIDPGHGGSATGAISPSGVPEKQINLKVARFLRGFLMAANADTVILTRNSDISISLWQREAIANNANVDWFHSVHHNAPGNPNDHTTDFSMVLYEEKVSGPEWPGQADVISDTISLMTARAFNLYNYGGVGDYTFYGGPSWLGVLNDLLMPGQLSEAFFISSDVEDIRIKNLDYLKTEAEAIYLSFLKQLGSNLPANGTIVGVIRDSYTKKPAINVNVSSLSSGRTNLVDSNGNGFFRMDSIFVSEDTLEFVSIMDSITQLEAVYIGRIPHANIMMDASIKVLPGTPSTPIMHSVIREDTEIVIKWYENPESNIEGYRLFHSYDGEQWTITQGENGLPYGTNEFRFAGLPNDFVLYFRVSALNNFPTPLVSLHSDVYGLRLSDVQTPILIVDAFDEQNSWARDSHYFAQIHGESISNQGNNFETTSNDAIIDGSVNLYDYETVVWIVGDEGRGDSTFTQIEQEYVRTFLENGGNLFVSGSEIGNDLIDSGSQGDSDFYRDYLKATFGGDFSGERVVSGNIGELFDGMVFEFGNKAIGSRYEEQFPDALIPYGGSEEVFNYLPTGVGAAVTYNGNFGTGTENGNLMYLGIPFETIHTVADRHEMMFHILTFFGREVTGVDKTPENNLPSEFVLHQNFPNPFNPVTTIKFEILSSTQVSINIYDLSGRVVKTIVNGIMESGIYEVEWDGSRWDGAPTASGLYLVRLSAGKESFTKKMIVIR